MKKNNLIEDIEVLRNISHIFHSIASTSWFKNRYCFFYILKNNYAPYSYTGMVSILLNLYIR